MLDLYRNIKIRREMLGMSQQELAHKVGYTDRSSIAKIEAGRVDLSQTKILEFAKALRTSPGELMGLDGIVPPEPIGRVGTAPIYNVAAGEGAYNGTYAYEYADEEIPEGCSVCTIHGNSMAPVLLDGDTVIVRHQTDVTPQDYTVVKVDGEHSTVKFVEIVKNGVWLRALNKEVYEDRFFTTQEVITLPVSIIGKVIELRRRF